VDFTIVTPSFRQLEQLGCCIASIADQGGVSVEHIVQDGGTAGFAEFAKKTAERWPDRPGYRRVMVSEKDKGMYDAINRGFEKAMGSICAYLNCDEQYLPDTLKKVAEAFRSNPQVDLFFGDALVIDEKGSARCWRKVLVPLVGHTWTCHFSAFTAAMFFRRRLLDKGIRFDTSYRAAADAAWYLEARRRGAQAGSLGFVTSTFIDSGENLGMTAIAREERDQLTLTAPFWVRLFRPGWLLLHRARRFLAGAHQSRSYVYQIFLPAFSKRKEFAASHLRATWPGRIWGY
jgi:glycosyltransferase involved in cell wall biosynthesis